MTDVATTRNDEQLVKKTHPVRGLLWGLMMGLGLSIVLVLTGIIPLALTQVLVVLALGTVAGTLWSIFGPAKRPKDGPMHPGVQTSPDVATTPQTEVVDAGTSIDGTDPSAEATILEAEHD